MPTYDFKNKDTGEQMLGVFMSISERTAYLEANPHIEQLPCAPAIVSGVAVGSRLKPDEGFREVLKDIKRNNVRSNINTF